jgi:hypothetical protein
LRKILSIKNANNAQTTRAMDEQNSYGCCKKKKISLAPKHETKIKNPEIASC